VLLATFSVSLVWATTPQTFRFVSQEDLEKGRPKGVSITSTGELLLSPQFNLLFDTGEPLCWSWVADRQGNLFVGSGNEGRVFKIDKAGKGRLFFDAEALEVYALAVDAKGNLYVGTSPNGKVFKVSAEQKSEVFFEPKQKYIWSMVFDEDGNLFVGTGDDGIIFKVDKSGKGAVFYDSEEMHIRSLALDKAGNLLAGSAGNGYVYRLSPDGTPFVLYDAPYREIHSLAVARDGTIYAGAAGKESAKPSPAVTRPEEVTPPEGKSEVALPVQVIQEQKPPPEVAIPGVARDMTSAIYAIGREGAVKNLWRSEEDRVHAVALDADGTVVVGTGDRGHLFRLSPTGEPTLLLELQESQITAVGKDPSGRLVLTTSNMGKVYSIGPELRQEGTYESEVKDAGTLSEWGTLTWLGDTPAGTRVEIFTRSGNTQDPNQTWSAWAPLAVDGKIMSPPARFIQWRAALSATKAGVTPRPRAFSLFYLQMNLAPEITDLTLLPPNEVLQGSSGLDSGSDETAGISTSKRTTKKGFQSASWNANDANNDQLQFDVYFKGEGEETWKGLKEDLRTKWYTWDSTQLPDGQYRIKVVVSDSPSNPANLAKTAEKISDVFIIDNTGPEVGDLVARPEALPGQGERFRLSFVVTDEWNPIKSVEFSIDAKDWTLIYPKDGICDEKGEEFEFVSDTLSQGEHTVMIRATDAAGNVGYGKTLLRSRTARGGGK